MKIGFGKNNTQMRILDAWMMIISFCWAMSYTFKSDILVKRALYYLFGSLRCSILSALKKHKN